MFRNTYLKSILNSDTNEYVVNIGEGNLLTPGGVTVSHNNKHFINEMISELMQFPEIEVENNSLTGEQLGYVSLYNLYSTLKDFVENSSPKLDDIFTDLVNDPLLHINPGPESIKQIDSWRPVSKYISKITSGDGESILFSGYSIDNKEFFALLNNADSHEIQTDKVPKFIDFYYAINKVWSDLSNQKKATVITLTHLSDSLLSSMCLVSGNCSPSEFSNAVLAAGVGHHMYGEIEGDSISAKDRHREIYKENVEIANICLTFLSYMDSDYELGVTIDKIINKGESLTTEFKETLSLDIEKQTKEKYIEISSLKTIAGFLNSKGGTLLVGVSDDGKCPGVIVEVDKFNKGNFDKFLLHFKNLLKKSIGEEYYPYIEYQLVSINKSKVLYVSCEKSEKPCYLDGKDFYVRTNPATDKLEGPKLVNYIQNHFDT